MKNIKFNTLLLFIIILFCIIHPSIQAQNNSSSVNEIKGFNKSLFDYHFNRADREINPERWIAEAKYGLTQAVYAWELLADSFYNDPIILENMKNQIINWSNEELEMRYTQWLTGRFFGDVTEKSLMEISLLLTNVQKHFTWHLDENNNIIIDITTGDPFVIRPDEIGREFSEDIIKWNNETESILKTSSQSFEYVMSCLYPELLAYVPEELKNSFKNIISETSASKIDSIKRDFENIAAREERIFINKRTRDIWSLRKKSDDEAASIFTERLISETEEICKKGIEEINSTIEEASVGTGELALLGEEWLKLYKEQFERGLRAWEEAEERFFIRRVEWEQESLRLYSDGYESWTEAYNKFEDERKKWELKTKELFQIGELLFKNISDTLEKNIDDAKKEFELNMAMRIGTGTVKIEALVDMYILSATTSFTVLENIKYLLNDYDSELNINPADAYFSDWLLNEKSDFSDEALGSSLDSINSFNSINKKIILDDIQKYYEMYTSYYKKAVEIRDNIMENYTEIMGSGLLKDILNPNSTSEDFTLDEYQIALIRAKALVSYWEKKTYIAEAVMKYAEELSAGRMTDAEGLQAWENAYAQYNQTLAIYEKEMQKLNDLTGELTNQQKIIDNLYEELQDASDKLKRLNEDLSLMIASNITNQTKNILNNLNGIYNAAVKDYKSILVSGEQAIYFALLENGYKWGISEQVDSAHNILNILINGSDNDILSLSDLENYFSKELISEINLKVRYAAISLFSDTTDGQMRPLNSSYSGTDWYLQIKNIDDSNISKSLYNGSNLYNQLIVDYENSYNRLLEERINFELQVLSEFINERIKDDHSMFIIDKEEAGIIYEVLSNLKERLMLGTGYYVKDEEENLIIDNFISGSSSYTGSVDQLDKYIEECLFAQELLKVYNGYGKYSLFLQNEILQESLTSLKILLGKYSISTDKYLPDAELLYEVISEKSGDIFENTAKFFIEFENCFTLIPKWLETEIDNWKNAVLSYIAANIYYNNKQPVLNAEHVYLASDGLYNSYLDAIQLVESSSYINNNEKEKINKYLAELSEEITVLSYMYQLTNRWETLNKDAIKAGDNKHWRQYLNEDYLENYDPILSIKTSWNESILEDAFFDIKFYSNRLNDAFALISTNIDFQPDKNSKYYNNQYDNELPKINANLYTLKYLYEDIEYNSRAYEISLLSKDILDNKIKNQKEIISRHEESTNFTRSEYLKGTEKFYNIGLSYNRQYDILRKSYNETEIKRLEYEKQDAIQRWAGSAYLDTDIINLDLCKNNLTKAETVLAVLSKLYNNESNRTYNNPEYDLLYSKYEQSFAIKLKILDAINTVSSELTQAENVNQKLLINYHNNLFKLGNIDPDYNDYKLPDSQNEWEIKNIITLENGKLSFSRNDMLISGINADTASKLNVFFNEKIIIDRESREITYFENSLRGLADRMSGYFTNKDKYLQWGLARHYLLSSLIEANKEIEFLNNYLPGLDEAKKGGKIGELNVRQSIKINDFKKLYNIINSNYLKKLDGICAEEWNKLSETEKADLEYYTILTLNGGNDDYFDGFSQIFTFCVYDYAYNYVKDKYSYAHKEDDKWYTLWFFKSMEKIDDNILKGMTSAYEGKVNSKNDWIQGLIRNFNAIKNAASAYNESCLNINILQGNTDNNQTINWESINNALIATNKLEPDDISLLKNYWDIMQSEYYINAKTTSEALSLLLNLVRNNEEINKKNLEIFWRTEEQNRKKNEAEYLKAVDDFFAGKIKVDVLKTAAEKAYINTSSWINHQNNLYKTVFSNLSLYPDKNINYTSEFKNLGNEIIQLTASALESRYNAELAAREVEWNVMRTDIKSKYDEWMNSIGQILERGRTDWESGKYKIDDSFKQWMQNFQDEYERVSNEWAEAYLAGLQDKELWLTQVEAAANNASAESFLTLVGAEGERLASFIDTREPFGIRDAMPDTNNLINDLLQASGIVNMEKAFSSQNNISNTAASTVRRGMGGISTWDAAITKAAASEFARKTNSEIADMEARQLAKNAKLAANEAVKNLGNVVDNANKNFQYSMDDQFISHGLWSKSSNNYVKEIVKGSTLFQPIISETITIQGYENYEMEPISLKTNLDENYLASLDSIIVMALIESVYTEIEDIMKDIFGKDDDKTQLADDTLADNENNIRTLPPGKFGAHIGYQPKVSENIEKSEGKRDAIFDDEGIGQLGRLMADFIYWSIKNDMGSAEIAIAPWDKRMWNDEGSFFPAPSLRQAGIFVGSVVAGIVSGGAATIAGTILSTIAINTVSEGIFTTLDYSFGYIDSGEFAFNIGKSLLTNTVTSIVSTAFSGIKVGDSIVKEGLISKAIGMVSGDANKVLVKTGMIGLQTATSSLVTTTLNSVTYGPDGIGWSKDTFKNGMNNLWKSTLTSIMSTFASTVMQVSNGGIDWGNASGFDNGQRGDMDHLNTLVGSLFGQGVNFALGNDFTLNVLNLGLLSGGKYQSGLLELHLGTNGTTMNLGSGGANVSFDNIASSINGIKHWNVLNKVDEYVKNKEFKYATALRAQYGYGNDVQTNQFWDILNGETDLVMGKDGDYEGKTIIDENGKRVVTLSASNSNLSVAEQMYLAVVLGHEAHRDGITMDDNYMETRIAAQGHTNMAIKMIVERQDIAMNENLFKDILAYQSGLDNFYSYVDNNYDSSADYWKLMENGSLLYDGDGWLKDSNGNYILDGKNRIGDNDIQKGLEKILGISSQEAFKMMKDQGFVNRQGTWIVENNKGKSITSTNTLYSNLYKNKLQQYNTLYIYDDLVAKGKMDMLPTHDPSNPIRVISYEEYKTNNFIQNRPIVNTHYVVEEGKVITASFNATGSLGVHRGIDIGVSKENVYPMFTNKDTYVEVFTGEKYLNDKTGLYVNIITDVKYTFKGKEYTDTIVQRMMHLDSISVDNGIITSSTKLGVSGNTGQWSGNSYLDHLHLDLYSNNNNGSPWLNYLSARSRAPISSPINYNNVVFYDPNIFLNKYKYGVANDAHIY